MGLSSVPPSDPTISIQLQQRIKTGILWVLGATVLFALPPAQLWDLESAFGVLLVLGLQNAINIVIGRTMVQSSLQDQAFLNTAWVLQIICGIACYLSGCVFPERNIHPRDLAKFGSF
jgi:hypothetical protein